MVSNDKGTILRQPDLWSLLLATAGIAIAGYLTLVHYRDSLLVCSGISDCETVQNSSYSEVAGIPIALMGLLLFVVLFGLMLFRLLRPENADSLRISDRSDRVLHIPDLPGTVCDSCHLPVVRGVVARVRWLADD